MPHELFVPVGATATIPIAYSYPHADPGLPAPADVKAASDNEDIAVASLGEGHNEVSILGVAEGTAAVTVAAAGVSEVVNVTVRVPQITGLSLRMNTARLEMSDMKAAEQARAQARGPQPMFGQTGAPQPQDANTDPLKPAEKKRLDELRANSNRTKDENAEFDTLQQRDTANAAAASGPGVGDDDTTYKGKSRRS